MTNDPPVPPWQMDWTVEARQAFDSMPADGQQLVLSARAELVNVLDPYYRGIDADITLPHWITIRPLASTSPGGPHIADLAAWPGLAHLHLHPPPCRTPDHRHRRFLGLTNPPLQGLAPTPASRVRFRPPSTPARRQHRRDLHTTGGYNRTHHTPDRTYMRSE